MTELPESPRQAASGLSSGEAGALLAQWGPNAMPEEHVSLAARLGRSLWQPVPWMLEATIVLEIALVTSGLLSPASPMGAVAGVALACLGLALALDRLKLLLARRMPVD